MPAILFTILVLFFLFLWCVWMFTGAEYEGHEEPWVEWNGDEPAESDFR